MLCTKHERIKQRLSWLIEPKLFYHVRPIPLSTLLHGWVLLCYRCAHSCVTAGLHFEIPWVGVGWLTKYLGAQLLFMGAK